MEREDNMAEKKYKLPAQVRTFLETVRGKKSKITEKDFTKKEIDEIKQAIKQSRTRGRKVQYYDDDGEVFKDRNNKAREKNKGSVDYKDYTTDRADTAIADFNLGKSGAIRNTLGKFDYVKTPDGRLIAKDTYDFKDDLVKEAKVRPSADYPKSTVGKIAAVAADTLFPTKSDGGFDYVPNPIKGIQTLPSRIGSAFVGADGRPVEIDLGEAPENFKKGGKVKRKLKVKRKPKDGRMKKAKGRDGIAQRGKTRGRMR
jgi:hypothetical protein